MMTSSSARRCSLSIFGLLEMSSSSPVGPLTSAVAFFGSSPSGLPSYSPSQQYLLLEVKKSIRHATPQADDGLSLRLTIRLRARIAFRIFVLPTPDMPTRSVRSGKNSVGASLQPVELSRYSI